MSSHIAPPLGGQHRRLLERLAAGDTPRCSARDFEILRKALPGVLQRESRNGADLRGGYVLTPLRSLDETRTAVRAHLVAQQADVD